MSCVVCLLTPLDTSVDEGELNSDGVIWATMGGRATGYLLCQLRHSLWKFNCCWTIIILQSHWLTGIWDKHSSEACYLSIHSLSLFAPEHPRGHHFPQLSGHDPMFKIWLPNWKLSTEVHICKIIQNIPTPTDTNRTNWGQFLSETCVGVCVLLISGAHYEKWILD